MIFVASNALPSHVLLQISRDQSMCLCNLYLKSYQFVVCGFFNQPPLTYVGSS